MNELKPRHLASPDQFRYFDSANYTEGESKLRDLQQNSPHFPASIILMNQEDPNMNLNTEISDYESKSNRLSILNQNLEDSHVSYPLSRSDSDKRLGFFETHFKNLNHLNHLNTSREKNASIKNASKNNTNLRHHANLERSPEANSLKRKYHNMAVVTLGKESRHNNSATREIHKEAYVHPNYRKFEEGLKLRQRAMFVQDGKNLLVHDGDEKYLFWLTF